MTTETEATSTTKIAIVTGGSRGIGRSIVLSLASRGVGSILTYNSNQTEAEKLAKTAVGLKNQGRLSDAADVMEEAFNKWPDLRDKYEPQVKLWRCGISM